MKFEIISIPSENVDYREVARIMRINIDILKKEMTDHVNEELERLESEILELRRIYINEKT